MINDKVDVRLSPSSSSGQYYIEENREKNDPAILHRKYACLTKTQVATLQSTSTQPKTT